MKSFEGLVSIIGSLNSHSDIDIYSQDFQDLIAYSRTLERSIIDTYIFLDSQPNAQREKMKTVLGEFAGHGGKSLDELFDKHELTQEDRKAILPFLESSDKHNELYPAIMDLNEDYALKYESEMIRTFNTYLKANKKNLSKETYKFLKRNSQKKSIGLLRYKIELKLNSIFG